MTDLSDSPHESGKDLSLLWPKVDSRPPQVPECAPPERAPPSRDGKGSRGVGPPFDEAAHGGAALPRLRGVTRAEPHTQEQRCNAREEEGRSARFFFHEHRLTNEEVLNI